MGGKEKRQGRGKPVGGRKEERNGLGRAERTAYGSWFIGEG